MELLVVMVVVSVIMGGVSIAINQGGKDKELNNLVDKFATLANHASEMAVLTGQPMGLMLEPPTWQVEENSGLDDPLEKGWRYRWQTMGVEGWQDYTELPVITIPSEFKLYVTIEGELWEWEEAPKVKLPAVAFYPGGDMTHFEIEFTYEDFDMSLIENVIVDDWGSIVWKEKAEMLEEIAEELGEQ
ncbi:type II secretion system protein H (GspH) [Alteromonadaceae bacterium Bs31]|nr:type II secretion system protein H (GspH) [Alteromonadaceae bacterium Bs31]